MMLYGYSMVIHMVSSAEVALTVRNTDGVSSGCVKFLISATQKEHTRANF